MGWIILIIVIALALFVVYHFNRIVVLRNRIKNAWAQIDVQLKRRFDLVPNLVETVKGYAKHEKSVFENVTKARSNWQNATDVKGQAEANNMLTGALKSLFAVAENYPDLKANENFKMLQEELAGIETKIAYSRGYYNDSILLYNNKIQTVPGVFIAPLFGFKENTEYFETEEGERGPVKVEF